MKSALIFLIVSIIALNSSYSQPVSWLWAESAGGLYSDYGSAICTDLFGNVYVAGSFEDDAITFGNVQLQNAGQSDFFVAKYSSSGVLLWAHGWGGNAFEYISSIATDNAGKLFITGVFASATLTFGGDTLIPIGGTDIFVASLDTAGNSLWAYGWGGYDDEYSTTIRADGNGNVFVNGSFDSYSFSTGTHTIYNVFPGLSDLFLVKMNQDGIVSWIKGIHGHEEESAMGLAVDGVTGDIWITGYYNSDSVVFDAIKVFDPQNGNLFVAKYDTTGQALWAKGFGGNNNIDYPYGMETDFSGNAYVTGFFYSDTIRFDSIAIARDGDANLFLAKIDAYGNAIWATTSRGAGISSGYQLAVDSSEHVYLTGDFDGPSVRIDSDSLQNLSPSLNNKALLVAKFDASGSLKWLKGATGMPYNYAMGICTDPTVLGDVLVTGAFSNPSLAFDNDTVTTQGGLDVFVARLGAGTIGILEIPNDIPISFYPNPVRDYMHVKMENESARFGIYTIQGKLVGEFMSNGVIDVSNLPDGVYFLRCGTNASRFIKVH